MINKAKTRYINMSANSLSLVQLMACGLASTWTNADLLSIKPKGIYLYDILFDITGFHSSRDV